MTKRKCVAGLREKREGRRQRYLYLINSGSGKIFTCVISAEIYNTCLACYTRVYMCARYHAYRRRRREAEGGKEIRVRTTQQFRVKCYVSESVMPMWAEANLWSPVSAHICLSISLCVCVCVYSYGYMKLCI